MCVPCLPILPCPTLPVHHTPGTPPVHHLYTCCTGCQRSAGCRVQDTSWAQRLSAAWVSLSIETALPRVVTVLRAFPAGKTARRRARTLKDWIDAGSIEPYTHLGQNNPEKARFLGFLVPRVRITSESPLLLLLRALSQPRLQMARNSHFCTLYAPAGRGIQGYSCSDSLIRQA